MKLKTADCVNAARLQMIMEKFCERVGNSHFHAVHCQISLAHSRIFFLTLSFSRFPHFIKVTKDSYSEACFNIINKKLRFHKEWQGGRGERKILILNSPEEIIYISTHFLCKRDAWGLQGGMEWRQETIRDNKKIELLNGCRFFVSFNSTISFQFIIYFTSSFYWLDD